MALSGLRLLVVEDNPGDRRLVIEMLRDLGVPAGSVEAAETLTAAIERLERGTFDVVFLDLHLPDAQGIGVLERLRLVSEGDVPVVVLTGLDDPEAGAEAVARGAHDYLVKGAVHADVLSRVVRYAVTRHKAMREASSERARAAAAEARLAALEESRAALEHEVAERRAAQADLERTLARMQAMRSIDRAVIANHRVEPMLQVVLHEAVSLLEVDAAAIRLVDGDRLAMAAQYGLPELGAGEAAHATVQVDPTMLDGAPLVVDLEVEVPGDAASIEALRLAGYRSCHVSALAARGTILGTLELLSRGRLEAGGDLSEFVAALADQAVVAIESARLQRSLVQANRDLIATYDATIDGWSHALDLRDRETEGHSRRVTALTLRLARAFGLGSAELAHVRRGALLHDIGKMAVSDTVLQKPSGLSSDEWTLMRRHPTFAHDLLEPIAYLGPALDIPYCHHERWDGSGYPRGLAGEAIPLAARIFAVADVYDALTSDRPYRPAWPRERALRYIAEAAGTQFDPRVVRVFLELRPWEAPVVPTPSADAAGAESDGVAAGADARGSADVGGTAADGGGNAADGGGTAAAGATATESTATDD